MNDDGQEQGVRGYVSRGFVRHCWDMCKRAQRGENLRCGSRLFVHSSLSAFDLCVRECKSEHIFAVRNVTPSPLMAEKCYPGDARASHSFVVRSTALHRETFHISMSATQCDVMCHAMCVMSSHEPALHLHQRESEVKCLLRRACRASPLCESTRLLQ